MKKIILTLEKFKSIFNVLIPKSVKTFLRIIIGKKNENLFKNQSFIKYLPKFIRKWSEILKKIINEVISMQPAYLISYPKSGRTWLRILIGKYLCEKFNFSDQILFHTTEITKHTTQHPLILTHDNTALHETDDFNQLKTNKSTYAGKKVIFLKRNIKDLLVSCYFQAIKRDKIYKDSISKFIRSNKFGVKKIVSFYNIWYENRKLPKKFLLLKYEDLHENPRKILIQVLRFLGLKNIENNIMEKAIYFANFDNMKKLEKENFFSDNSLKPGNIMDEESYKVRKGIIGGYKFYLSNNDIEYIDKIIREMGCPFEN